MLNIIEGFNPGQYHRVKVRPLRYFTIKGHRGFVYRDADGLYYAAEYRTGFALGASGETVRDAILNAGLYIGSRTAEQVERAIVAMIKKSGAANPPEEKKP